MLHLLFSVFVGAVIGLFTNWIAIVMLFRPHKEIRLFGRRLPFTPGLIPRRQPELADKLGEIVEEELLTTEGLAKQLKRPTVEFAVKRAAVQSIGEMLNESPTLGELVVRLLGERVFQQAEQSLVNKVVLFLNTEAGREKLEKFADTLSQHLRQTLSQQDVRRELARGLSSPIYSNLTEWKVTWGSALPTGVRDLVAARLEAQLDPLLKGAANWLHEPDVVAAIAKMLQEKVENIPLIGGMAKSFLTPERVASDIVPRLQSVIDSQTTRDLVNAKLNEMVQEFWDRPIGSSLGTLTIDELSALLEKTLGLLLENMQAPVGEEAPHSIIKKFVVSGLQAGANYTTINDMVRRILEQVANWNIRTLYIGHVERVDVLVVQTWRYLRDRMIDALPELLEALSIREVVREQVISFPIPTLEKLITSVVNKELKMITYLGGLLGGVIGLIQALIAV